MAKRNQVTTDLRISADAQLKSSRSFISQLDKIIDKFDFGDKINNQLIGAKNQLKDYNKILEKVQNKSLISDEELKDLIKAGKEITNIVNRTEKLYANLDSNQLQKFSKEYINQVKATEEAVARIKNEYTAKTGKNFDKELANYDKLSAKVKALEQEKANLAKNGTTQIVTREIEQLNQKLEEQKNKLLEIKKVQADSSKVYSSTLDKESKKRGYDSFDDLKGIRGQSEEQIRKQLGNAEYKQQSNILTEINRQIKEIEKNKQEGNQADRAAIALAKKYKIENISTLQGLKEQVRLKKENLNQFKNNKSDLANEKLVSAEFERQNKILADREAIINAAKKAELTVIQKNSPYNSKASLTAGASATNRSVNNLESQLTETGIEQITNNAAQIVAGQIAKLNTEITKGNQDLAGIDATNKKLATQSERAADEQDIKDMQGSVNNNLYETGKNINNHTTNSDNKVTKSILNALNPVGSSQDFETLTTSYISDVDFDTQKMSKEYSVFFEKINQSLKDLSLGITNSREIEKIVSEEERVMNAIFEQIREGINSAYTQNVEESISVQKSNLPANVKKAQKKNIDEEMIRTTGDEIVFNRFQENFKKDISNIRQRFSTKKDNSFKLYADDMNILAKNTSKAAEQSAYLGSTFDDLKNKVGYFLSMNYVFDQITRKINEATNFTKELDKDMVQIGLVLGETSSKTWKNFDTYAKMADRLNTTVSDVTGAMKLFYQQGLSTVEVNKMVEASAIAAALGESSMAEASETLTSIINGYNLSANQAMAVTDKISMVAMVSAADFGELSTAIEKVASSAASAGLDLDHMMGYLGKMIETTREAPTNIGTALKTIVANFTQFKEDPTGLTEEGSDINKVDTALKSVGISLTDVNGDVRDLSDVLDELGKKWSGLTRNQKSYLATQIAGTRQQSRFYALMNDYGRTLELVGEAANSDGKATSQFALYQDSLTAATSRLNNEWEKFYNNTLKNDTALKLLQNTGTGLLKIANKLGPILTTIVGTQLIKGARSVFTHFAKIREEISNINQAILSTEQISNRAMIGKDVFSGYSFNKKKNNSKMMQSNNSFGQEIASKIFDKKGGKEQTKQLKEYLKLQQLLNEGTEEELKKQAGKIKRIIDETAGQEALTGAISATTKAKMADVVQTQADTVAHTMSTSVKWGEVAAQLALNLAIMAGVAVIAAIGAGISYLINKRHEETLAAQEQAKTAREEYNQLKELGDSYLELSTRVNRTAQEKEELEQATQDLLEQYPSLIAYIDEEGKAYAKTSAEIKKYMKEKEQDAIRTEKNAAISTLNDKSFKTNAIWKGAFFSNVYKEKDEKMYGERQKSARDDLYNAFNNLESSGIDGGYEKLIDGKKNSLQGFIAKENYDAVDKWLQDARDQANREIERIKNISPKAVKEEDRQSQISTQQKKLDSITEMEKSVKGYQNAVKEDLADLAEKIYNKTISDAGLDDTKESLTKNILKAKTKNELKNKNNNEISTYLQSQEYTDLQNGVVNRVKNLSNATVVRVEDFMTEIGTDTTQSFAQIRDKANELKEIVPDAADLIDDSIKSYEEIINTLAGTDLEKRKNFEGLKLSTLNLLADAKNEMQGDTSEGFNEAEFNKIYGQMNESFLRDLDNLDTSDLGAVNEFKQKYAEILGNYGIDFLNTLVKNPEYDAEKAAERLSGALSNAIGQGTTKSGASISDIASGSSDEGGANILSSDDETRAQNILLIGQKVKVSAEEISDSYRQAYKEVMNTTGQIISQAETKINDHVKTIQQTIKNQDWKVGDNVDYSNLTEAEKEIVKNSQKAITNLKKQTEYAKELQDRYKTLSIGQKANIDYGNFRNGTIAANEMINSLSNLADIYDVVTTKEYTQLDLINWIANDTSGQLLAALEVQNGQLSLNANSMEILAEAEKQEAINTIDNEIAKTEAQIAYVEAHGATSQQVLDDLDAINTGEGQLSSNTATYMSSMMKNFTDWATNVKTNGFTIGAVLSGLIKMYNSLHKAETEGNGSEGNQVEGGGTGATGTEDTGNKDGIDDVVTLDVLQDKLAKLKALREGLNKMSGKDLLGGINKMGSYGGDGSGKDKDEIDPLLEKLEHFYNYLRKIEKLESKLTALAERRNLIDANNNYYIDDLKEENELLNEQQKLYTSYIADEEGYLAELRQRLKDSDYGDKVYFDEDGLIQVNQTEFTAETEEEQEKLKAFLEVVQEYQDEYNTKLENQNKLIQTQVQQLENVKKMYDKILQRISDVTEEIERQIGLTEHNQTMEFSEIEQIDLSFFKAGQNVEGIQYTSKEIAKLNKEIASINKTVKNLPYSELLEWDEELQQWNVNEEKMKDPAIKKKYEEMGYTWSDIETSVRSITTQSQSLNKSLKETVEKSNSFRENLKQILDDVISGITDFFSRSTDMINQYFHQIERGMDDIDNQNDLFGVNSESLENKYKTLVQSVVIMKQLNTALQEERKKTEKELTKSYGAYVTFVNGVAVMNEQAVDNSTKLTEEQKAELKTLIAAYNSATDQIEGLEDKQLEYFQKMMEMEEAKRDAIIELKQQVHDELMARDQEEIDNLRSKYEKMNQLDQEYYSELQQRVSDARDLRDRRQESNNIGQMQARLAVLKADNSGTYNSELIELQKQLNQALQTQADNDVNRELERIQREQKQREEDRALTISAMENVLTFKDENNWYWQEAQRIWNEGPESVTGFLRSSREYMNISDEQRAKSFEDLDTSVNNAFVALQTAAGITASISDGIVSQGFLDVKDKIDYIQQQLGSGEGGVIYSQLTKTEGSITSMKDALKKSVDATPESFKSKMSDLYNKQIGTDVQSASKAIVKYLGNDSTLLTKTKSIVDKITGVDNALKGKDSVLNNGISSGFTTLRNALLGETDSVSANINTYLNKYLGQNSTIWKYLSKKYADEYGKKETQNTKPTTTPNVAKPNNNNQPKNDNNTPKPGGGNGTPEVGDVVTYIGGTYYSSSDGGTPVGKRGPGKKVTITRIVPNAAYPIHVKSSDSAYGWLKKSQISGYRKGGYVDYTGVAEVHGSRKDPEAFLNVKQTRLFEELRDSLVRKNVNSVYDKDPVEISKEEYNIDKINIEVKQIADVDAVEKVTKKVKEEIYKDAVGNNNMAVRRR